MSDDLTTGWPMMRISPQNKARLERIKKESRNGISLTKLMNGLLEDAMDAVEGKTAEATNITAMLKQQTGKAAGPVDPQSADLQSLYVMLSSVIHDLGETRKELGLTPLQATIARSALEVLCPPKGKLHGPEIPARVVRSTSHPGSTISSLNEDGPPEGRKATSGPHPKSTRGARKMAHAEASKKG